MQGTSVRPLGQKDTLEKKMATHSSIIAWNPLDRGAWQAAVHGSQESDTTQWLKHHIRSLVLSVYVSVHVENIIKIELIK